MNFWIEKFGSDIFVLDNEELVGNQEKVSREIVKFCALEWEKECLEFLVDHQDIVIATGGGMPCSDNAIGLMIELGETLYLEAEVSTLISRLWNEQSGRPIITDIETKEDLHRFISNHLSEREEYFKKCKHIVCVDVKSIEEISKEIKRILL